MPILQGFYPKKKGVKSECKGGLAWTSRKPKEIEIRDEWSWNRAGMELEFGVKKRYRGSPTMTGVDVGSARFLHCLTTSLGLLYSQHTPFIQGSMSTGKGGFFINTI